MKSEDQTWREYLAALCQDQLEEHDAEAALSDFDELVEELDDDDVANPDRDAFIQVCDEYEVSYDDDL